MTDATRIGYWSDSQNAAHGHQLYMTPRGDLACVTLVTAPNAPIPLEPGDLRVVGEVLSLVLTFPAGAAPLAPPPPATDGCLGGQDADGDG